MVAWKVIISFLANLSSVLMQNLGIKIFNPGGELQIPEGQEDGFNDKKMKVTVLTNNILFTGVLESEHGLSLFVETDMGIKILFDTGQTGIFYRNAEKLGIHVEEAEYIVFSHGHYDHTGGFRSLHKTLENKKLIFNSSNFFNKTKKENLSFKFIGIKQDE